MIRQAKEYAGAVARANPGGDIFFVDGNNGSDGNDGLSRLHPKATLASAIASAQAGDTIICSPGGSETRTATIAANLARLKIVCPTDNPEAGYTITGAGTVDLMTVSAANVHIEGLRFTRSAAAGSTTAALLTTADADGLTVKGCSFDSSDSTSSWTNYGVELTGAITDVLIDGCVFRDLHRGVLTAGNGGLNLTFRDCTFWVGQATAFGIHVNTTTTAVFVDRCVFFEADGDGSGATDAWDGTDGTNAASGPILMGANCDRWVSLDCLAYSARDVQFGNLHAINAGAAGEHVNSHTHQRSDVSAVSSDTAAIESDTTIIMSQTTVIESDSIVVESNTEAIHSQTTVMESDSIILESDSVVIESNTEAIHSQTTVIESDSIVVESNTEAIHSQTTVVESDTTVIESDAAKISSDLVLMTPGYPVAIYGTLADTAIGNNTQAAGNTLCTATGGAVLIEDVVIAKDSTALAGPTNIELSTDNAYGETGVNDPVLVEAIGTLGSQGRLSAIADGDTEKFPFVLESTKKLYLHGDDSAGTSGGNVNFGVIGRALADGAYLA